MLEKVRQEVAFDLDDVVIDGDNALEARYRERIPVVTIDGEEAFVLFVHPGALRRRLGGS